MVGILLDSSAGGHMNERACVWSLLLSQLDRRKKGRGWVLPGSFCEFADLLSIIVQVLAKSSTTKDKEINCEHTC